MGNMELIIKIPEEAYKLLKNEGVDWLGAEHILNAVANGTPLPKGHDNLKDMGDIYEALEGWDDDTGWIVDAIDCQAPTIVEADKESEVKENDKRRADRFWRDVS